MKRGSKIKMSYEPEADVLRVEAGRRPIDYATEVGNMIIHFSREGLPVYFEILEASKFVKKARTLLRPTTGKVLAALH